MQDILKILSKVQGIGSVEFALGYVSDFVYLLTCSQISSFDLTCYSDLEASSPNVNALRSVR